MDNRVLWELTNLAFLRIAPTILNCEGNAAIEDLVIRSNPDIARDIALIRSYQSRMHENSVKWRDLFDAAEREENRLASS